MRFDWKTFLIALIFSFAVAALGLVSIVLFQALVPDSQAIVLMNLGVSVLSFFISPLLLFGVLYFVGRKVDLVSEFLPVVISLFLGCLVGHLIGYFPLQLLYAIATGEMLVSQSLRLIDVFSLVWYAFRSAFSGEFFVGFTALGIAYIVKKRSP